MTTNKQQISIGVFEKKHCGVCGYEQINQFFNINESYIEYCGNFHSLIDVLNESLDIKINHNNGKTIEICFDCKDKVIKFYNFKRKVKEVHQMNQQQKVIIHNDKQKTSQKTNKVVHNIYKIIENYTEKCSVTAIRVDEESKKLIIQANEVNAVNEKPVAIKQEPESQIFNITNEFEEEQFAISEGSIFSEDLSTMYNSETDSVIEIKEEPLDVEEIQILQQPIASTSMPMARKRTSQPIIHQISASSNSFSQRNRQNRRSEKPISAAAIKMRLYREKLKKPENREKYIQHQLKQKEWNRQYYQRKQMKDMEMDFMY